MDFSDEEDYNVSYESEADIEMEEENTVDTIKPLDDKYVTEFEILNTDYFKDLGHEAKNVVNLPLVYIRLLLDSFNWNTQSMYDEWYSFQEKIINENPRVKSFMILGIVDFENTKSAFGKCNICLDDISKKLIGTYCGHLYCTECWEEYLKIKISNGTGFKYLECMTTNCDILLDDEFVLKNLKCNKSQRFYNRQILNSYITTNRTHVKFCPGSQCDSLIKIIYQNYTDISCKCGYEFCFPCGEDGHAPVPCDILKRWDDNIEANSLTMKWINAFTQKCPQCNVTIQKDGGCNHMTCRRCSFEFCWICLRVWNDHSDIGHTCGRFKPEPKQLSIKNHDRFEFFFKRFTGHKKSLEFEKKFKELYDTKKQNIENDCDVTQTELFFLKDSIDVLSHCRKTLMYSYTFSYFLDETNQSHIFMENQENLHVSVEKLSASLEEELNRPYYKLNWIRQEIKPKYDYCKAREIKLLEHVYENLSIKEWKYIESGSSYF